MSLQQQRSMQTGELPAVVAGMPIVNVWYAGRSIGLYRVIDVEPRAMLLKHGAISFPVGTPLEVVDFQRLLPEATDRRVSTTVVDNDRSGIRLSW